MTYADLLVNRNMFVAFGHSAHKASESIQERLNAFQAAAKARGNDARMIDVTTHRWDGGLFRRDTWEIRVTVVEVPKS